MVKENQTRNYLANCFCRISLGIICITLLGFQDRAGGEETDSIDEYEQEFGKCVGFECLSKWKKVSQFRGYNVFKDQNSSWMINADGWHVYAVRKLDPLCWMTYRFSPSSEIELYRNINTPKDDYRGRFKQFCPPEAKCFKNFSIETQKHENSRRIIKFKPGIQTERFYEWNFDIWDKSDLFGKFIIKAGKYSKSVSVDFSGAAIGDAFCTRLIEEYVQDKTDDWNKQLPQR